MKTAIIIGGGAAEEVWRDIPGYERYYQASSFGRIKALARTIYHSQNGIYSCAELIMKPITQKKGYLRVSLSKNGIRKSYQVHNLVLLAFVGPRPKGLKETRHFPDKNPTNNNINNISYGTSKQNADDKEIHETSKLCVHRGIDNGSSVLRESQVIIIAKSVLSTRALARQYQVDRKTIKAIREGKTWSWLTGIIAE